MIKKVKPGDVIKLEKQKTIKALKHITIIHG